MAEQKWPDRLWLVRHGQSAGNVARDAAEAAQLPMIDIAERDMDVPLSDLGRRQAWALGEWFGALSHAERPSVVLTSPYLRAIQSARLLLEGAGMPESELTLRHDERLREKEFGLTDRLTKAGIAARYPELAEQRAHVGKFYFRPPGGESWCDVILRLRSVLEMVVREYRGERVLIVGHQVIVNCFRYLLERLDERQILDIDRRADVPNCSVTSYRFDPALGRTGKLVLDQVNFIAPLAEARAPITAEPDAPVAPKP
ncbi:histidine phosphatase family protein [Chitiniphilus eburneus]|uniref:phosphoglycerate mutase (2,3-diphosphoglycerate-dependent) n=1 Tax=Chitiniphilus eburneus TaxID=2571148 RepID=A0A4U0Q1D4_9NEIS|nr:histidine phosphatase family protein [Chitiniphilus eburneus]TJZ73802.1 histidine phosphatase family protein [Chitiniphilus eburneus]